MIFSKKSKLEEQLSLKSFLTSANFDKLYLVNLCLIFVGSIVNLGARYQKNECIGLISVIKTDPIVECPIF